MVGAAGSVPVRERAIGLLRRAKAPLVRAGLGSVFNSAAIRAVRRALFRVRLADVVAVLGALDAAGVRCWLAGGWGIDGLLGEQTRRHNDLDLCVEVTDDGEARAIAALADLGYRVTAARADSGLLFPVRVVLRDQWGRTIDLLLVTAGDSRAEGDHDVPRLDGSDLATGRLGGTEVGCLAPAIQLRAHAGYVPQARDRQDVGRLCAHLGLEPPTAYRRPWPEAVTWRHRARKALEVGHQLVLPGRAPTALMVTVPAAQAVVEACGGVGPGDPPAHVTVLWPFVPARLADRRLEEELARLLERLPPFSFRLTELAAFPDAVYLAPDPPEPFAELTDAVARRWPDYPPYRGAFEPMIPHLTLGHGVGIADLEPTVAPHLPIEATAAEVVLVARDRLGSWHQRSRFPLAGGGEP